jgi:DNA-binding transcriptional MocR family regulator
MPGYLDIAEQVATLIDKRVLRSGERIPSVRRATRSHRVNPGTVLRAYHELEARGLIEARPRSGYYVRTAAARQLPEPDPSSPTTRGKVIASDDLIVEIIHSMNRPHVVALGVGILHPELLPNEEVRRAAARATRRLKPSTIVSSLPPGDPFLRRLIAKRYMDFGCAIDHEDIVIMSGGREAVVIALRAITKPGDTVAIESPVGWPFIGALAGLGLRVREIRTDPQSGIDLAALEQACEAQRFAAIFVQPSFQDPLGSRMSDESKRSLLKLSVRYGVPVIEHDRVSELYLDGVRPRPLKSFDRTGAVLHCGSLATCVSPTYKIGWIASGQHRVQIERTKILLSLSASPGDQAIMAEFLAHCPVERHYRQLRLAVAARRDAMISAISRDFPVGCRMTRPSGGFQLWVQLPKGADALRLYRLAMARGVSFGPGPMFSARHDYSDCLRLSYGYASVQQIRDGIRTIAELIPKASA